MFDALLLAVYIPFANEVRVTSSRDTTIDVACASENRSVALAAKTTLIERCSDDVMRIDDDVAVDAIRRNANATTSMPILDARNAISEGTIARLDDVNWRSAIGVINPNDSTASIAFSDVRGDIPPHAMRMIETTSATFTATQPLLVFRVDTNAHSGARVITLATTIPHRRRAVKVPAIAQPTPHTVTLAPSKDNTLYETTDGSVSNGAGVHLFTGDTAAFSRRRALIAFDLASQIPPGSTVTSVSLSMQVSKTIAGDEAVELHAVSQDWGEGTSNAGAGRDGGGTAAKTGDATWLHTFFPSKRWTNPGGDFAPAADASTNINSSGTTATWATSASFVARAQAWVNQPSTNFGWIIIDDERFAATSKEFDSREQVPASVRPALTIEYTTQ